MLAAFIVFVGSFVCLMMVIFSVAVGFTFFVVPILLAELMLLAAVYLMREAFGSKKEKPDREPPLAWYAKRDQPPPRALERLDERYSRPYRTETARPRRVE